MRNYFIFFIVSLIVITIMNCDDSSIAIPGNYKDLDQKNPVNGGVDWYEGFEGDQDNQGHRGRLGGWRFSGLPWKQG